MENLYTRSASLRLRPQSESVFFAIAGAEAHANPTGKASTCPEFLTLIPFRLSFCRRQFPRKDPPKRLLPNLFIYNLRAIRRKRLAPVICQTEVFRRTSNVKCAHKEVYSRVSEPQVRQVLAIGTSAMASRLYRGLSPVFVDLRVTLLAGLRADVVRRLCRRRLLLLFFA